MTEINETLTSDVEALRSEDLQETLEVVNSTRNDFLRISEMIAEINNSMLAPEVRDKEAIPTDGDWRMSNQAILL